MEKHLVTWSYWLGIACFAIALVWKTWSAFGLWLPKGMTAAQTISYMTFYKGGLLFFLLVKSGLSRRIKLSTRPLKEWPTKQWEPCS